MKKILLFLSVMMLTKAHGQTFEIYVSDAGNFSNPPWQILKFDSSGQNPDIFISTNLNWPQDILFLEDSGTVLISNLGTGNIARYNSTDGTYLSDFATSIGGPTRMKIGPDSLLYVLQWLGDGFVRKYHLDGTFAGNFTSVPVTQAIGLDWDQNDNLYVSSYGGKYVRRFNALGVDMGLFIDSNLLGPTNIWFNDDNELLVIDYNGTSVKKFDSSGAFIGDFILGINQGEGVCFLPNGDIAIGSGTTNSVRRYDSMGNYLNDLILPGSGNLITPNAVVLREVLNVSVEETNLSAKKIIYPTTGTEFHFSNLISKAQETKLYTLDGKFIQTIPMENTWKPVNIAAGYYIVKVIFTEQNIVSEKIYISK